MGRSSVMVETALLEASLWLKKITTHLGAGLILTLSACLLILSIAKPEQARLLRGIMLDINTRLEKSLKTSVSFVPAAADVVKKYQLTAEEVKKLQAENERLYGWYQQARLLERENTLLRAQLKVLKPSEDIVLTAPVIGQWEDEAQHKLMIEGGRRAGVEEGAPVVMGRVLVGYVESVGSKSALVATIRDGRVRIPVVGEKSGRHGVLSGQGSNALVLLHTQDHTEFEPGEMLLTTAQGSFYPPGYIVARVVVGKNGAQMLKPELSATPPDFVRVLKKIEEVPRE